MASSCCSSSSQPVPLLHHPLTQRHTCTFPFFPYATAATAATTKLLLTTPSKPSHLPRLLYSPSTPPSPSTASTSSSSSLSDQLRGLSDALLRDTSSSSSSTPPRRSRSTWVNPAKPRPSPLSLRRHRRSNIFTLPSGRRLSRAISSLPLPSTTSSSSFDAALRDLIPDPPDREIALSLLKSVRPWQHAYGLFRWLQSLQGFQVETIFYNVVMKSLRIGYQYDLVEELAQEMVSQDVEMDNITYSTVITCAKRRHDFDCAVGWFERMYKTGPMPDEVTYSAVLDVYAHSGRVEEVLSFFERGRACGWKPDPVALAVITKAFGERGDYDGIKYVLREMKNLGVERNLVLYNTLIEASGKAGAPGIARDLFEEMRGLGLEPDVRMLTALIKTYGKARWKKDALDLWEQIRENNWPMDLFSYNALLSMCADLGLEEEAEMLFVEMKNLERSKPDSWSYTGMVNIYANGGKVDKAMELFREMLDRGLEPNVMTCTCLIQCFGKIRRIDDVVNVFNALVKRGIKPDDRLSCSLLSILGFCEEEVEMGKILKCLEVADLKLANFVRMLDDDQVRLNVVKEEFRGILNGIRMESRRPFSNCLIDICHNQSFPPRRARELFRLAAMHGLYPQLHSKDSEGSNSLNLKSLSFGAARVAFEGWMRKLSGDLKSDEGALPQKFFVHTGAGSHRYSNGLGNAVASHFADLSVPFRQSETNGGCFVATKEDLVPWLQARSKASAATSTLST